jgi:cyanate permease
MACGVVRLGFLGNSLIGYIAGPVLVGSSFDLTGSYKLGFTLLPMISLLSLLAIWIAKVAPEEEGMVRDVRAEA